MERLHPVIFGSLFEGSLDLKQRHIEGAHFTYEADIQKIVRPTIVKPWEEKIGNASNAADLVELIKNVRQYRVLDPACGSVNFLFVAYLALREIEQKLLLKLFTQDKRYFKRMGLASGILPLSFFGLDKNENAVEVAKVTLMLARRLAHRYSEQFWDAHRDELPGQDTESLQLERDLPLDHLKDNIVCADALFTKWPEVDVIGGNPPYQSKNKMQKEFGAAYSTQVRRAFPQVPGRADYCVYWFRKAHDQLRNGMRAGLVGTNTVRQNYSRIGGLDYIVANGGTITDAVSSQVWSGDAVVNVSIVNWVKGASPGKKPLFEQLGDRLDSPWRQWMLPKIPSSLSPTFDVTQAAKLETNAASPLCKQGQTPGHKGFLLTPEQAAEFNAQDDKNSEVLFPYLIGKTDLLGLPTPTPTRWVIDFHPRDVNEAARFKAPFKHVQEKVLPTREKGAADEDARNEELGEEIPDEDGNQHHKRFLGKWWQLSWPRPELMRALVKIPRYIVCVRVTKRPIFEFASSEIHPSDALTVFAAADDYTFGVLQSPVHWTWFNARCSSLKRDPRYTSDTVFDSFPWPEITTKERPLVVSIAKAGRLLRELRRKIMAANEWTLRDVYRTMELPGENELRSAHQALDQSVRALFGMSGRDDALEFLFNLNQEYAQREAEGAKVPSPGLPDFMAKDATLFSTDCIPCPKL